MSTEFADAAADARLVDKRMTAFAISGQKRLFANIIMYLLAMTWIGFCSGRKRGTG